MSAKVGVSPAQLQRVWAARGLKPHGVETFKLSTGPPASEIVLCLAGKISSQALDHNQPPLPMKKVRGKTMTHHDKHNGTTALFAALEVATGKVSGSCVDEHRHEELPAFLKTIEKQVPKGLKTRLILDNSATHSPAGVKSWLANIPDSVCISPRHHRPG